jgi:hypothetical protein
MRLTASASSNGGAGLIDGGPTAACSSRLLLVVPDRTEDLNGMIVTCDVGTHQLLLYQLEGEPGFELLAGSGSIAWPSSTDGAESAEPPELM